MSLAKQRHAVRMRNFRLFSAMFHNFYDSVQVFNQERAFLIHANSTFTTFSFYKLVQYNGRNHTSAIPYISFIIIFIIIKLQPNWFVFG